MINQTLREARRYEEVSEKSINKAERPAFHLSTRTGWMNDPNGFSFYDGKFHLFYQYNPYESKWGPMHWGHAVSEDFLHWEYLPAVLAPDEIYDKDGCFSGSAVELEDGRHLLMYTGVSKEREGENDYREVQTQCIAIGDGIDYVKYEDNPVLNKDNLPEGSSKYDFRDPKIWRNKRGTYNCVVGNRPADGSGQILLFESEDALHWTFKNVLIANQSRFGKMWECPDFFELDGKWVVITSPQDMLPKDFEYHNGNGTLCLIGDYNEAEGTFDYEKDHSVDYGIDFYAPQTTLAPDGRRIMIGWMQNWDTCSIRPVEEPWFGQMTIPRELSIKNGRLYQAPVRELNAMRTGKVEYNNQKISGVQVLDGVSGRKIDMELVIRPENTQELFQKFALRFAQNDEFHTALSFRPKEGILKVDRKFSGSRKAIIHQRRSKVNCAGGQLKLRIILDYYSAEIFVNDGEQTMTITMYTDLAADGISFFADGDVIVDVVKYDLV